MSDDTRKPPHQSHPRSMPPEVPAELDSSWDDDTMPRLELDDPMSESAFDRVTAIPELPPELYAKQLMSNQPLDSAPPGVERELPRIASEPPVVSVRPLDPMGMQQPPRAGRTSSLSEVSASQHSASNPNSATARPGRNRAAMPAEPTGLELMDLGPPAPATVRNPSSSGRGHDPRDPVLELDLGEVARSGPPPPVFMPSPPASGRDAEISEMKDRYAMGDFTGALVVAEGMLEVN